MPKKPPEPPESPLSALIAKWAMPGVDPVAADDAMTTEEIVAATGRDATWVCAQLRKLRDAGRLELTHRNSMRIDGRLLRVPAYRILPE